MNAYLRQARPPWAAGTRPAPATESGKPLALAISPASPVGNGHPIQKSCPPLPPAPAAAPLPKSHIRSLPPPSAVLHNCSHFLSPSPAAATRADPASRSLSTATTPLPHTPTAPCIPASALANDSATPSVQGWHAQTLADCWHRMKTTSHVTEFLDIGPLAQPYASVSYRQTTRQTVHLGHRSTKSLQPNNPSFHQAYETSPAQPLPTPI